MIFAAALCYSAVGHAGASGYLAVMALAGIAPASMRPAALIMNLAVASIGTVQFVRAGWFRWRLLLPFAVTSIPMAFLGGKITLPTHLYKLMVGIVLLLSALRFAVTLRAVDAPRREPPVPLAMVCGALLGFLAGLTGVGGGIFLSPLLLLAGWADLRTTAATSVTFILANSAAGLAGQQPSLDVLPDHFAIWLLAAIGGGAIGSWLGARRLPLPVMRGVLAVVLVVAGVKMLAG